MRVSVVIPHYSDLGGLDSCLSALAAQTFPAAEMEIIVADNESPQGLQAVERVVGARARLITVAQRGAGPARNGGAAAARSEILAFIDSDCRAEATWLAEGIAALKQFDIVGGSVDVLVDDPERMTAAEAFERVFAFNMEHYLTRKGFVGSGNLFCRRQVFEAVGGFGFGVSEDIDWSHRAAAKHFRIGYAAKAAVGHPARKSWDELQRKWSRINAETYGLALQRGHVGLPWLMKSLLLPASALAHTPKVLMSNRLKGRQKLGALAILYRLRFWRMLDSCRLLLDGPRP